MYNHLLRSSFSISFNISSKKFSGTYVIPFDTYPWLTFNKQSDFYLFVLGDVNGCFEDFVCYFSFINGYKNFLKHIHCRL